MLQIVIEYLCARYWARQWYSRDLTPLASMGHGVMVGIGVKVIHVVKHGQQLYEEDPA